MQRGPPEKLPTSQSGVLTPRREHADTVHDRRGRYCTRKAECASGTNRYVIYTYYIHAALSALPYGAECLAFTPQQTLTVSKEGRKGGFRGVGGEGRGGGEAL